MHYLELRELFADYSVFSLADIKRIDSTFYRRRLTEWQGKGYLKKIIRGYYIFSDVELNEHVLFEIANGIYRPSYVSFEMALSFYHLIPESVYGITSASTRKTYSFSTFLGEFSYRTISPDLFFGYDIVSNNKRHFKIACCEKAILDYFYIHSDLKSERDFASMRINRDVFLKQIQEKKLDAFLEKFSQKSLSRRITALINFLKHA